MRSIEHKVQTIHTILVTSNTVQGKISLQQMIKQAFSSNFKLWDKVAYRNTPEMSYTELLKIKA